MEPNEKNLAKLESLLKMLDNGLTKEEFVTVLEKVIELVLKIEKRNSDAVSSIEETYKLLIERIKNDHSSTLSDLKKQVDSVFVDKQISKIRQDLTDAIQKKINSVKDGAPGRPGKDADEPRIISQIEKGIRVPKDGSPDSPLEIKKKIESLTGDERIDKSAIKGLENGDNGVRLVGGNRGIALYVGGVKKGFARTINFIGGTNITITHTLSNGRNDILIDNSSSGLTNLPATGAINSVNADFTFAQKPTYIISDGAWYKENKGWTWNAGTLTATMTIPPNDDIYGFA